MLDPHRPAGLANPSGMLTGSCLDTGLLVSRDHELIVLQRPAIPAALVEVQNAASFKRKVRVAREDPSSMLPRTDCVLVQPSPNGAIADGGHNSRLADFGFQLTHAPTRQRNITGGRQFTGKGLNLNDEFWGEKPGVARGDRALQDPLSVLRKNAFATGSQLHGAYRDAKQFHRWTVLQPPLGSSWRAVPENTVTYIVLRGDLTPGLQTWTS